MVGVAQNEESLAQRCTLPASTRLDAISIGVVRRFGAREIAPQGQEVESANAS